MAAKKATIYIYDDLLVVDDTETYYTDKNQLESIAKSMLNQTPDGITAEVWTDKKIILKFRKDRKGRIAKMKISLHPNWGGRREGAGAPSKGAAALINRVVLHVNEEMFEFCESLGTEKAEWIRQAISEKRERERQDSESNKG